MLIQLSRGPVYGEFIIIDLCLISARPLTRISSGNPLRTISVIRCGAEELKAPASNELCHCSEGIFVFVFCNVVFMISISTNEGIIKSIVHGCTPSPTCDK